MIPLISTILMLSGTAQAQPEEARVFVSPFQASNREAAGLAALLPGFLAQELDGHPDLSVVPIEALGPVHEMPAETYAESCPSGEFVGCAFVLGESGGADFAIAGTVESLVTGTQVEIHIVDVARAEDVLSFQVDLGMGDDEVFAEGVAGVLVAVVRGEAGRAADIRAGGDSEYADDDWDKLAVSRQLDQLSKEIGDVTTMARRSGGHIDRPKISMTDLADQMTSDGITPWERVDMDPQEYVRYQNSGLNLATWRKREQGRKGQLLLRPYLGFGRGPMSGSYHGEFIKDYDENLNDFVVLETWAWHSMTTSGGMLYGAQFAYGLTPIIEVGFSIGGGIGTYETQFLSRSASTETNSTPPADAYANSVFNAGAQVLVAPMQTFRVRPVVGAHVGYWLGTSVDQHVAPPPELPNFERVKAVTVGPVVGGEARMSDNLDVWVHLPVSLLVGGSTGSEFHDGSGYITTNTPDEVGTIGAALIAGVQVRMFGPRQKVNLDDY